MQSLSIGELGRAAGVKVPTIRFYEQIGLLPTPSRSASERRQYGPAAIRRLAFIRHARQLGFPVDAVRVFLDLADQPNRPCEEADRLAREQLAAVDSRIARLGALRQELQRMVDAACAGNISECRVIEALDDHQLCAHADHFAADDSGLAR